MTPENLIEQESGAPHERYSSSEYVISALQKLEVEDAEGVLRPVYSIAGRDIVFRTRNDAPQFPQGVFVVGGENATPLPFSTWDEAKGTVFADNERVEKYVRESSVDAEGSVIAVTNTPESIILAAAHLEVDEDRAADLEAIGRDVARREYSMPESRELVDQLLAAMTVDERTGQLRSLVDEDGWAIGLAGLLGDPTAAEIINDRHAILMADKENSDRHSQLVSEIKSKVEALGIEPIPLNELALVHSTGYAIERDDSGNVVLSAAGDKRDDKFPRASLHFTVNSRAYAHAQATDSWGDDQTLIVANLKKVSAYKKLSVLDGVDSWATLSPGEKMKLPDATLVVPDSTSSELLTITDSEIRFASKELYADDEAEQIRSLARQKGVYGESLREMLKEIALKMALSAQGVPDELHDRPSDSGHGMSNADLAQRIIATAAENGMTSGTHFNYPEAMAEMDLSSRIQGFSDATNVSVIHGAQASYDLRKVMPSVSLDMRRMMFANGYFATRNSHYKQKPVAEDNGI